MANQNIFQRNIVPEKPRALRDERVYVYVPKASNNSPGIASYNQRDFGVNDGLVSLKWPMDMQIERLSDPTSMISRIKVLSDEFENTGEIVSVTNPVTGVKYESSTAEVQLKRTDRNAFERPDFMQVDPMDFEATRGEDGYVKYTLKVNNPFTRPSLVQLDNQDFKQNAAGIVQINWPIASTGEGTSNTNGLGLVKIAPNSEGFLRYSDNGDLEVDIETLIGTEYMSIKPTYGGTLESGFVDINDYVGQGGYAKRGPNGELLLAINKDSVGLSKVENKAFSDYVYNDFGDQMQEHFQNEFDLKLDKAVWDNLFSNWNPPTEDKATPQQWFESLEDADEAIRDQFRSIRLFLGYFEDLNALTAVYPASETVYGSTAYLLLYRTYYAVRTQNVDKMLDTDALATSYDPPKDSEGKYLYSIYITGSRATGNRFVWTEESGTYRAYGEPGDAIWVDYFLGEDEDLNPFIEENKATLKVGDRIGIRETGKVYIWNGTEAQVSADTVYYEWYDTGLSNLSFMDFVEKNANAFQPDGEASPGNSGLWAQSNHVHPRDPSKLDLETFKRTKVTVTTNYQTEDNFVFSFWEQDENGNYIPNREVNIPYVRKGQTLHNWQGSPSEFVDSIPSSEHYWAGTAEQYTQEKESIPNNSFIVVDDNEDFVVEDFLSHEDLDKQGITIDPYNPIDKFIITTNEEAENLIGVPLTITHTTVNGNDRYYLSSIAGLTGDGAMVVTQVVDDKVTLKSQSFAPSKVISSDENGNLAALTMIPNDLIATSRLGAGVTLPKGRLVLTSDENVVTTFNTGDISERLLVADGFGGVTLKTFNFPGSILISNDEQTIEEAALNADNLIVSALSHDASILPSGEIAITGSGNTLTTYDTGNVQNKMLISNGTGGLKVSEIAANKLLYTSAQGVPAGFAMTAADAGKYVGVSSGGAPTLLQAPVTPTTLPVTTYTTNPGANANGTVVAILSADPGTYSQGVLYLW